MPAAIRSAASFSAGRGLLKEKSRLSPQSELQKGKPGQVMVYG
jgi:hypothetical protein